MVEFNKLIKKLGKLTNIEAVIEQHIVIGVVFFLVIFIFVLFNITDFSFLQNDTLATTQDWQYEGVEDFANVDRLGNIEFNPNTNEAYVAFSDADNSNRVTVMRYDGTNWVIVGSAGFSGGSAFEVKLDFHPTTFEPYVAFQDASNSYKANVMRFNGSSWVSVGSPTGVGTNSAEGIDLRFNDFNDQLYLSFNDQDPIVMQWNGSAWSTIINGLPAIISRDTSLAFAPNSPDVYLAFGVYGGTGAVRVYRYPITGTWTQIGSDLLGFSAVGHDVDMEIHPTDLQPYVMFDFDSGTGNNLVVQYYNGSSWNLDGITEAKFMI